MNKYKKSVDEDDLYENDVSEAYLEDEKQRKPKGKKLKKMRDNYDR